MSDHHPPRFFSSVPQIDEGRSAVNKSTPITNTHWSRILAQGFVDNPWLLLCLAMHRTSTPAPHYDHLPPSRWSQHAIGTQLRYFLQCSNTTIDQVLGSAIILLFLFKEKPQKNRSELFVLAQMLFNHCCLLLLLFICCVNDWLTDWSWKVVDFDHSWEQLVYLPLSLCFI